MQIEIHKSKNNTNHIVDLYSYVLNKLKEKITDLAVINIQDNIFFK